MFQICAWLLVYVLVTTMIHPYHDRPINRVEIFSLLTSVCLYFTGLFILTGQVKGTADTVFVVLALYSVYITFLRYWGKHAWRFERRKFAGMLHGRTKDPKLRGAMLIARTLDLSLKRKGFEAIREEAEIVEISRDLRDLVMKARAERDCGVCTLQ